MFVVALSRQEVGIDLEKVSDRVDYDAIADAYFAAEEVKELREFPPQARQEKFFQMWTGKEALLKALGVGIGQGLEVNPQKHSWNVRGISAPKGYVAGLAFHGDDVVVKTFEWSLNKAT